MHSRAAVWAIGISLLLVGCVIDRPAAPVNSSSHPSFSLASGPVGKTYVLIAGGNALPEGLAGAVAAAGGTLTQSVDRIGVAVAISADPDFVTRAAGIRGLASVSEDIVLQFTPTESSAEVRVDESAVTEPAASVGATESFRLIQWAPDAINGPAAWDAGNLGAGARVAILDGGIYNAHADIAPGLDVAHSISFVPGQPYNADGGTFWHGTHVAGIVAARANGIGTVGIAPASTIIGVKVLHNGSGAFSWIIPAIVHAATPIAEGGAGADIINMSLGATIAKGGPGVADLLGALSRATSYARQRGTLVIAAAGNSAIDIDHTANIVFVPAQSVGVLTVAATGPLGFAHGATDYDRPASYTNFGQSAIQLGAPGGDFALPGNDLCAIARVGGGNPVVTACWVFDMVMAPCRGSNPASTTTYCWAAGTSMASPAVAGVAALIIGKYGRMDPAQLEARLRQTADDLGKAGNDDFYGRGRVNAARAVGVE